MGLNFLKMCVLAKIEKKNGKNFKTLSLYAVVEH